MSRGLASQGAQSVPEGGHNLRHPDLRQRKTLRDVVPESNYSSPTCQGTCRVKSKQPQQTASCSEHEQPKASKHTKLTLPERRTRLYKRKEDRPKPERVGGQGNLANALEHAKGEIDLRLQSSVATMLLQLAGTRQRMVCLEGFKILGLSELDNFYRKATPTSFTAQTEPPNAKCLDSAQIYTNGVGQSPSQEKYFKFLASPHNLSCCEKTQTIYETYSSPSSRMFPIPESLVEKTFKNPFRLIECLCLRLLM